MLDTLGNRYRRVVQASQLSRTCTILHCIKRCGTPASRLTASRLSPQQATECDSGQRSMERHEAGRIWLQHLVQDDPCFDNTALQGLKDIKTSHGRLTCTLPVEPRVQNRYGTLHGGATATLADTVGSAALVTMSLKSGVSLSISVNYISAMPGGEDAEIDARVIKVGQSIATIDVLIRRKKTGQLVSQAVHVKFLNVGGDKKQAEVQDEKTCGADDAVSAAMQKRGSKVSLPQSKL